MSKLFIFSGKSSLSTSRLSSPSSVLRATTGSGDIHNHLKASMGTKQYKELEASDCLRLKAIYIRSTKLRGSDDKKGIVNHDLVVVELEDRRPQSAGCVNLYHIHAEKVQGSGGGPDQSKTGIHIRWSEDFKFNGKLDRKYNCFDTPIRLDQVLEVLERPSANYDVVDANCWQYAATVTQDLILKLLDLVKDDDYSTLSKLQDVLTSAQKHLEDAETIIPKAVGASAMAVAGLAIVGASAVVLSNIAKDDCNNQEEEDIEG